jgi:FkbM family methyltransferase
MLIDYIKDVRHIEEKIFDAINALPAPVVLWGAGELSWYITSYLRSHGIEPVCMCDNNPAKQGTVHLGLKVYSYEYLKEKFAPQGGKYHMIVSTGPQYKDAIISQLAAAHEKNPVWYLRGYEVCGKKITYQYVCQHLRKFEEAYSSLSDELSKKVFVNVLNAKLSGDFSLYAGIMSGTEYFDEEVVKLKEDEVFLDVGAYKGKDIVEFARLTNGKYNGIIALEPDKKTLTILQDTVNCHGIKDVEVHAKGAWHKHAFLHFHDGREGSSRVSETTDMAFPSTSIEVDTIENLLNGRRVTYISMDIEGAEHNAILGAERTIKKWKPKIAVCVYHKREDLFDLLLLLKSFVPDYKFYMRHYTENQTETVLYAI